MNFKRKYPIGAEYIKEKGVHFRVWAPEHKKVQVHVENTSICLEKEKGEYFSGFVPGVEKGSSYQFSIDQSKKRLPDPASRYQPEGTEGPSCVIDPFYPWTDQKWPGVDPEGQVLYEMHIGTFTQEGTFQAALKELPYLAKMGISVIEMMPLNEFPGKFGWGYDGINLFAPYHVYGTPDDLKAFIDKAHSLKIGVILDVVYNHFGPEGNFLNQFSKHYVNPKRTTEWGDSINFDHPSSREFFLTNAKYWIEEFHFDGLRVDATPWIYCDTKEHVLAELTKVVRAASPKKKRLIIGESEKQDATHLKKFQEGGYEFDGLWNDDFHHSACVRLKGKREAYYTDYLGSPQEFISALKYGFLYQGQYYVWQKKERGSFALNMCPSNFVIFLENHDQVANSGKGERLHSQVDPGNYRAMTCLFLLGPNTPLLFQGQEFGSSSPFLYFADHNLSLNHLIKKGRKKFLSQFPRLKTKEIQNHLNDPASLSTFNSCKLNLSEREKNKTMLALHKDLISLRRKDPIFKQVCSLKVDGAVLSRDAFLIRIFGGKLGDRLMMINFGTDLRLIPSSEPLLVPGDQLKWSVIWSSESVKYGGEGTPPLEIPPWRLLGHSAVVFKTEKKEK